MKYFLIKDYAFLRHDGESESRSVGPTLCDPMDYTVHGILQARVGSLLQGVFPTQGWNPGLPHCRRILYQLSHRGSPSLALQVANGGDTPHLSSEQTCLHSRVAPSLERGWAGFPEALRWDWMMPFAECWAALGLPVLLCGSQDLRAGKFYSASYYAVSRKQVFFWFFFFFGFVF